MARKIHESLKGLPNYLTYAEYTALLPMFPYLDRSMPDVEHFLTSIPWVRINWKADSMGVYEPTMQDYWDGSEVPTYNIPAPNHWGDKHLVYMWADVGSKPLISYDADLTLQFIDIKYHLVPFCSLHSRNDATCIFAHRAERTYLHRNVVKNDPKHAWNVDHYYPQTLGV